MVLLLVAIRQNFNPRSLTGATAYNPAMFSKGLTISIHAPSRERPTLKRSWSSSTAFQSTLPHGSDHGQTETEPTLRIFQSTLPHGSDNNHYGISYASSISIHAPSRERHKAIDKKVFEKEFQSTLPHGSDGKLKTAKKIQLLISIHAPSRERPRSYQR